MLTDLITQFVKLGPVAPPWAAAAAFLYLFLQERKDKNDLTQQIIDLAIEQTAALESCSNTLESVERDIEDIRREVNAR